MAKAKDFRLKAQTGGSHPGLERQTLVSGVYLCSCQVADPVVEQAWANLFFSVHVRHEPDQWVLDMIRLADVGFVD